MNNNNDKLQPMTIEEVRAELQGNPRPAHILKPRRKLANPIKRDHLKLVAVLAIPVLLGLCVYVAWQKRTIIAGYLLTDGAKKEEAKTKEVLELRAQRVLNKFEGATLAFNEGVKKAALSDSSCEQHLNLAISLAQEIHQVDFTFKSSTVNFEDIRRSAEKLETDAKLALENFKGKSAPAASNVRASQPQAVAALNEEEEYLKILEQKVATLEAEQQRRERIAALEERLGMLNAREAHATKSSLEKISSARRETEEKEAAAARALIARELEHQKAAQVASDALKKRLLTQSQPAVVQRSKTLVEGAIQAKKNSVENLRAVVKRVGEEREYLLPRLNNVNSSIDSTALKISNLNSRIETFTSFGKKPPKEYVDEVGRLEGQMVALVREKTEVDAKREQIDTDLFHAKHQVEQASNELESLVRELASIVNSEERDESEKRELVELDKRVTQIESEISRIRATSINPSASMEMLTYNRKVTLSNIDNLINANTGNSYNFEIEAEKKKLLSIERNIAEANNIVENQQETRNRIGALEKERDQLVRRKKEILTR